MHACMAMAHGLGASPCRGSQRVGRVGWSVGRRCVPLRAAPLGRVLHRRLCTPVRPGLPSLASRVPCAGAYVVVALTPDG